MRSITLAAATALLCGSTALVAQPSGSTPANQAGQRTQASSIAATIEQQAALESWSGDQRTQYLAWPADQRTYFWTLTPPQQEAWWSLTPEQRTQIYGMTPEQRTQTWTSIEAQLAGTQQPGAAGGSETAGSSGQTVSQPSTGAQRPGKTKGSTGGN